MIAMVASKFHKLKVIGSIPISATINININIMYDFNFFKRNEGIKYQCKNEFNQTLRLEFNKWYFSFSNKEQWFVVFYITDKKKHGYKFLEQTGKDGIKSLLWAKKCLLDFINNQINKRIDNQIIIYWDNIKRKKVYEWGLKEFGFKMSIVDKRPALILKINKTI